MPRRAWNWRHRVSFNATSVAGLDFGQELWRWEVSRYESAPGIESRLRAQGRPADSDDVMYYVTRNLVTDVIDGAAGVEQAHIKLGEAMNKAQVTYDQWQQQYEANDPSYVPSPNHGMTDESVEDAWYSLESMLIWTRILEDRLKRRSLPNSGLPDQGLIPALIDGPRRRAVLAARDRLTNAVFDEVRPYVNLHLHAHPLYLGTRNAHVTDGHVWLRFPDAATRPIFSSIELTYKDNRDGLTVANSVMDAVERFIDEMLTAFEANVPPRLQRPAMLQMSRAMRHGR
jgi:hypothetical protein